MSCTSPPFFVRDLQSRSRTNGSLRAYLRKRAVHPSRAQIDTACSGAAYLKIILLPRRKIVRERTTNPATTAWLAGSVDGGTACACVGDEARCRTQHARGHGAGRCAVGIADRSRYPGERCDRKLLAILCGGVVSCSLVSGASDLVIGGAEVPAPAQPSAEAGDRRTRLRGRRRRSGHRRFDGDRRAAVVDTTFGSGGTCAVGFGSSEAGRSLSIAADGSMSSAEERDANIATQYAIARLSPSGVLDYDLRDNGGQDDGRLRVRLRRRSRTSRTRPTDTSSPARQSWDPASRTASSSRRRALDSTGALSLFLADGQSRRGRRPRQQQARNRRCCASASRANPTTSSWSQARTPPRRVRRRRA